MCLNFPSAACPVCGQPGFNITSITDHYFRYACTNRDCTGPRYFDGDPISPQHRRDGEERIRLQQQIAMLKMADITVSASMPPDQSPPPPPASSS